jgi:peptidoglycan/xylan/chitin deacetylase (PgdA/CDA1 family)
MVSRLLNGRRAMTRSNSTILALAAAFGCGVPPAHDAPAPARQVAITIDDLPVSQDSASTDADRRRITEGILAALVKHRVPAIGFVNETKLRGTGGETDTARVGLLRRWLESGQELGNHTFSHPDLHRSPVAEFLREIARGDSVTRLLLAERGTTPRWFRHPFLHTGRSLGARDSVHAFLHERGYRVAPVSIDNYDYLFAVAYRRARRGGDDSAAVRIGDAYVAYIDTAFGYWEQQSRTLLGRDIPHVLLLHAHELNADRLDDLLAMMRRRGYRFVPIGQAVADSAYALPDEYAGPAGMSWIHRWALTAGKRGAVFAGEPDVPGWVAERAR